MRAIQVITTDPVSMAGVRCASAANAWASKLLDITGVCNNNARWDDIITLGACYFLDVGNALHDGYGIMPNDLIAELLRLPTIYQHEISRYSTKLSVANFDDKTSQYVTGTGIISN